MNEIQNSLFEAMKVFSDKTLQKDNSTKIIQAETTSIIDVGLGKYEVKYLENTFSAHTNNQNSSFAIGDIVYVLIPNGNFSENKIILGLVNPKVDVYNQKIQNANYREISDNLIFNSFDIALSSYEDFYSLKQNVTDKLLINQILPKYLKDYHTFSLSFDVQTSLAIEQQTSGNYGFSINIPLIEKGAGGQNKSYVKTVTFDTGVMAGNPYKLTEWTTQELFFSIDNHYDFNITKEITFNYFCYGFPHNQSKTNIKDILIKDIKMTVVKEIAEDEQKGMSLTLKATEGEYYTQNYKNVKTVSATLRINNKKTSLKDSEVYWFIENTEVGNSHEDYVGYGGFGWKCINPKTNIITNADGTKTSSRVVKMPQIEINQADVGLETRFKCVVVNKGVQTSAFITLKNLLSENKIFIESNSISNTFLKDTGFVELSVYSYIRGVTESDLYKMSVLYSWLRYDKNGVAIADKADFFEVVEYNTLVQYNSLPCYLTRVKYPVNKLEGINTVYCSVKTIILENGYNIEKNIGTKSILLKTNINSGYILEINNANKVFKYDANGNSPFTTNYSGGSRLESLPALTYTLKKPDGNELTLEEYAYVEYKWILPKQSLLSLATGQSFTTEDKDNYYISGFDNARHNINLAYKIANRFNINKTKQTLRLEVVFQGNKITKEVPFTFIKEGMTGTNGTSYYAELVAGGLSSGTSVPYNSTPAKKLKFVYNTLRRALFRYDYDLNSFTFWGNNKRRIFPKVYMNGELISDYTIEYSLFDARTTNPCFYIAHIDNTNGVQLELSKEPNLTETYCNILQAKITPRQHSVSASPQILYAYYPIELTVVNQDIDISLDVQGGFSEVMYASDGTNPTYEDATPFSCVNDKAINEDLSNFYNIGWVGMGHLSPAQGFGKEYYGKPINKYDDGNSKNLITTTLTFKPEKIGEVQAKINAKRQEIVYYQQQINEYTHNFNSLQNFARAYQQQKWQQQISQIKVLLEREADTAYQLNNLLDTAIVSLDNYISTQYRTNKPNILNICAPLTQQVLQLKGKAASALRKIQDLDGSVGNGFNDLISLVSFSLNWNAEIKSNYQSSLGLDTTLTLQLLIEDINRSVILYEEKLNSLKQLSSYGFENILRQTVEEIRQACYNIPDNSFPYYVIMKRNLLSYINEIAGSTSEKSILSLLDKIYKNILNTTFTFENNILQINQNTIDNRNREVNIFGQKIGVLNKEIADLTTLLNTHNTIIIHHKPLVFYFNRYEMSNINAWDGNKIETGDGSYLLAPQIGAGIKEPDNSFTGLVMGLKNLSGGGNAATLKKGLFGYYKGQQTLCLDASNGSAIFGKSGNGGQIIIDPATTDAMLYSSSFFKNYDRYTGLPRGYTSANYNKQGMLINLSKPEIRFGNGNFVVDQYGNTTIAGTNNKIGGWRVSDTTIYSDRNVWEGRITLDSGSIVEGIDAEGNRVYRNVSAGRLYSHSHSELNNGSVGFYLSADGLSLGSKVKIDTNGIVKIGSGAVTGIGKHWTIDGAENSFIGYNTTAFNAFNLGSTDYHINGGHNQVYLGTDGIRLGSRFAVDADGNVVARNLIAKEGGNIGGWEIEEDALSSSGIVINSNGSIYTSNFSENGRGWMISASGVGHFNELIANRSGSIGGWEISSRGIASGNISLDKNGSIRSSGGNGSWSVNQDGSARFSNVTITGGSLSINNAARIDSNGDARFNNVTCNNIWSFGSGNNRWTNEGFSFGQGSLGGNTVTNNTFVHNQGSVTINGSGASLSPSGTSFSGGKTSVDGKNIKTYIKDLTVEALDVEGSLTFRNKACSWQNVRIVSKIDMTWYYSKGHIPKDRYLDVSGSVDAKGHIDAEVDMGNEVRYISDIKCRYLVNNIWILTNKSGDEEKDGGKEG